MIIRSGFFGSRKNLDDWKTKKWKPFIGEASICGIGSFWTCWSSFCNLFIALVCMFIVFESKKFVLLRFYETRKQVYCLFCFLLSCVVSMHWFVWLIDMLSCQSKKKALFEFQQHFLLWRCKTIICTKSQYIFSFSKTKKLLLLFRKRFTIIL